MKKILLGLLFIAAIIVLWIYYSIPCDYVNGWLGTYPEKECNCIGKEVVTSDDVLVDGPYITQCIGIKIPKEVEQPNVPQY